MLVTPRMSLPYPERPDTADVPRDIKALADRLDLVGGRAPGIIYNDQPILDVGVAGQIRAGRQLTPADFTTMGLSAPLGLWNLSNLNDSSGNGRNLTNMGAVPFAVGINGLVTTAAQFAGSAGQSLYVNDSGGSDPFRIRTGSWGCWMRTARRNIQQVAIGKYDSGVIVSLLSFKISASQGNVVSATISTEVTADVVVSGLSDVCDNRWHFAVATYDGSKLRVYCDGFLEGTLLVRGTIMQGASAVMIGGQTAASAVGFPSYGRVDEGFITADVLSEDQIRNLYCAKVAHGYATTPTSLNVTVRRRARGGPLAASDFPTQPLRLYNFTAGVLTTDEGSGSVALTNAGALSVAGADGAAAGGASFAGGQSLTSTDEGLPSALVTHSYGCWFKTSTSYAAMHVVGWGVRSVGAHAEIFVESDGTLSAYSGGNHIDGPFVADGNWHYVVVVEDDGAADGTRRKLYLDGRMVGGSTIMNPITLGFTSGFSAFGIGGLADGTPIFFTGQIDGAFVCNYALTSEQVIGLWDKSSHVLLASPKEPDASIEAVDATNVYMLFDALDTNALVDLEVQA